MIDFENQILTKVAAAIRAVSPTVSVKGEFAGMPAVFPAVTVAEIENVQVEHLIDSSHLDEYAGVTYRIQVFSNKKVGRKSEAKALFDKADDAMREMGFRRVTYATSPELYNSTIYQIGATYRGTISASGYVCAR